MNYYAARQRKDGRWDYTCKSDGYISPIGYCSPYREPKVDEWFWTPESIKGYQAQKEFHHSDGHATAEEACKCYKKYLLDTTLRVDCENEDVQYKCEICKAWTTHYAIVDGSDTYHLCDEHRTKEIVESLFSVGWSCQS